MDNPIEPIEETVPETAAPARRMLSAEQVIANAPNDLKEEYVDGVFPDENGVPGSVKIRSLTAAQQTQIKQVSIKVGGRDTAIVWAEMERLQFRYGVIEPRFNADQVKDLHLKSGGSFAKVIDAIDKISGLNKKELREAQEDFQGSDE